MLDILHCSIYTRMYHHRIGIMLRALLISCCLSAAPAAFAQAYYAQQNYPAPSAYPSQQQVSDNSQTSQPIYAPQPYPPHYQAAPPAPARAPAPSDYGQSVVTDIRQMNF
jgi:hypothetical protein